MNAAKECSPPPPPPPPKKKKLLPSPFVRKPLLASLCYIGSLSSCFQGEVKQGKWGGLLDSLMCSR